MLVKNRNYWRKCAEKRREKIDSMRTNRMEQQQRGIDFLERIAKQVGSDANAPKTEQK